jgi:hypothetical protein
MDMTLLSSDFASFGADRTATATPATGRRLPLAEIVGVGALLLVAVGAVAIRGALAVHLI